jgi:hypothetical protein
MLEQGTPCRIQMHDVASDWVVLEQEPVQTIAIVHGEKSA